MIIPTYHSEQDCDLYEDLNIYEQILQDDIIVKAFLKKYPNSTSYVEGIDESYPPKAWIIYSSNNNKTENELWIYIREVSPENENDCFWPVQYIYKDYEKPLSIQYYSWEKQRLINFLSSVLTSPYEQWHQGIDLQDIKCKEGLILIIKYDGSPACVKPETKQKLIERGWAKSEKH